jgi:hypothetical protein
MPRVDLQRRDYADVKEKLKLVRFRMMNGYEQQRLTKTASYGVVEKICYDLITLQLQLLLTAQKFIHEIQNSNDKSNPGERTVDDRAES